MFDLFREISQTLQNNKLRTFLTGIAVAWGIFMLIVLLGMARGVVNSFEEGGWAKSSNRINLYQGVTSKPFKGYKEGRIITPYVSDMDLLKDKNSDLVSDVSTSASLGTTQFSTSKDYVSGSTWGVYPNELAKSNLKIIAGRFINEADLKYNRKTLVMEEKTAKSLFGDDKSAVGQRVDGLGLSWLVVGVYSHDWRSTLYVPFTTVKSLTGNDKYVRNLQVEIKNVSTLEEGEAAEEQIRATMAHKHEFAVDDTSGVYTYNQFTDYLRSKTAFDILNMSVWIIGIFTLLSGIIGVSNIMFVSVRERTHEIGIRRAIGAKPRSILLQIIMESVVITAIFGYVGIVLGMIVTQIIAAITEGADFLSNPTVSLQIALEVTIVLIFAGSLAGLFPAMKATKVKPVEALRDE